MGQVRAAGAAAALRVSYPRVEFAIVTGVCGGVPLPSPGREILLGDVVISKKIVQYDFGRLYSDKFEVRDAVDHSLVGAPTILGSLLAKLQADHNLNLMKESTGEFLKKIQEKNRLSRYRYPGAGNDRLFPANYQHRHRAGNFSSDELDCDCRNHKTAGDPVCPESRELPCGKAQCELSALEIRKRLEVKKSYESCHQNEKAQAPAIFVGTIGSGNNVIRSGVDRDEIARRHSGILAFEMESFGVWNSIPCIMVKGVCDYADSHKNKDWQHFAAATAAAATKALLQRHTKRDASPRPR
ncbi:nucleoside phosphorylase domain-containing protein [Cladorrhinum samala]|uniref:Nucleoside phosphorylase domain-containing protein n=1 Tax=Cladorrhinum samala TaxID=585594 RepID=A0AAV9HAA0_9PEZI|nr:nucleoside phosphorylase domain-containing protein [Cladorrhinum samala]